MQPPLIPTSMDPGPDATMDPRSPPPWLLALRHHVSWPNTPPPTRTSQCVRRAPGAAPQRPIFGVRRRGVCGGGRGVSKEGVALVATSGRGRLARLIPCHRIIRCPSSPTPVVSSPRCCPKLCQALCKFASGMVFASDF